MGDPTPSVFFGAHICNKIRNKSVKYTSPSMLDGAMSLPLPSNRPLPQTIKSAGDFMYAQKRFAWMKGSEQNQLCHKVWMKLHEPFLLPRSICNHTLGMRIWNMHMMPFSSRKQHNTGVVGSGTDSAWQVYDINQAGCMLCGAMHICFDGVCPVPLTRVL